MLAQVPRPRRLVDAFRELDEAHEVRRAQVQRAGGAAEVERAVGRQLALRVLAHVTPVLHAALGHAEPLRTRMVAEPRDRDLALGEFGPGEHRRSAGGGGARGRREGVELGGGHNVGQRAQLGREVGHLERAHAQRLRARPQQFYDG